MFWQHSQYDSRLGFSFRVLVRVRVSVRLTLILTLTPTLKPTLTLTSYLTLTRRPNHNHNPNHNPIINPNPDLTLTKTLKLNPNLLSYWDCCQNMVTTRQRASRRAAETRSLLAQRGLLHKWATYVNDLLQPAAW